MDGLDRVINLKLMSHPMNWLIIWTVMLFAGFAWALVHERVTAALPSTVTT